MEDIPSEPFMYSTLCAGLLSFVVVTKLERNVSMRNRSRLLKTSMSNISKSVEQKRRIKNENWTDASGSNCPRIS